MSSHETSCRELVEVVTEYFEGTLPEPDRHRFEEHLAVCDGCQTYLEQMRRTIELTGSLSEESIPEQDQQQLLQIFRGWRESAPG